MQVLLLVFCVVRSSADYLKNPDFEDVLGREWGCHGHCHVQRSQDYVFHGKYSGFISQRQPNDAVFQEVQGLQAGHSYLLQGYVYIPALPEGKLSTNVVIQARLFHENGTRETRTLSHLPFLRPEHSWRLFAGDLSLHANHSIDKVLFTVQPRSTLDYYIDFLSLKEIEKDHNWKSAANERIESIRKGNFKLKLTLDKTCDLSKVTFKVNHTQHHFPFGSAVRADAISGKTESDLKYQQVFYNNFNTAVLTNAFKWRETEKEKGVVDYQKADDALDALAKHNVPVRGHCIVWDFKEKSPDWLGDPEYKDRVMLDQIRQRLRHAVTHFRDRVIHWDVDNEQCHGDWLERRTEEPALLDALFLAAHRLDPQVQLFLNDFNVISQGDRTACVVGVAKMLKKKKIPLGGIGIQAHFTSSPSIELIHSRLSLLASAEVPLWLTEMDFRFVAEPERLLEDVLRLAFSLRQVEGVMLWGFSDLHMNVNDTALFQGEALEPTPLGLAWQRLVRREWSTHASLQPARHHVIFTHRGFHGNYSVQLLYKDQPLETQYFYLYPGEAATASLTFLTQCPTQ